MARVSTDILRPRIMGGRLRLLQVCLVLATLVIVSFGEAVATATSASSSPFGNFQGKSRRIDNFNSQLLQPDGHEYASYCGPGASRVLISAWTRKVPGIDELAAQERTDRKWGTPAANMVGPINRAIGHNYYRLAQATSMSDFANIIGREVLNRRHPLITEAKTRAPAGKPVLRGWARTVSHYVMIYGFDFRSSKAAKVNYFETAGKEAGTTATGFNTMPLRDFWTLVSLSDIQITGPS